jgi:type I restriction enzyme S subunit
MLYPPTKFDAFLNHRKQFIQIEDTEKYKRARVQLHWKGIVLRDEVEGAIIKTKDQQIARQGELLVAEIDAKVGGVGIVPPELDRAIVSSHYFLFEIDESKCLRPWLDWFVRSGGLGDQFAARGSTNYAAIRPQHILNCEIPLPPLDEQRRIVSRIEELAAKIAEATHLQEEIRSQMDALCRALIINPPDGVITPTVMSDLLVLRKPDVKVEATDSYQFAGVYCFGRGVFAGQRKDGSEFAYRILTRVQQGNFVYPKLMAWEGALGVVPEKCDGLYVSPEFPVFEIREDRVLPEVLDTYFRMPSVWPDLAGISTGTNVRRRRLHPRAFLQYKFPLPSMKVQRQFCVVRRTIEQAKRVKSESTRELDALMPSILSKAFHGEIRKYA